MIACIKLWETIDLFQYKCGFEASRIKLLFVKQTIPESG